MYGLSADDALKLREAFASIGWSRRIGPGLKKISADLEPPLDNSHETILFAVHSDSSDHIQDVRIDDMNLPHNHVEAIGTDRRIIFLDTDKMSYYAYPYEELGSVDIPANGGVLKEINYSIHTKSGHTISLTVRLGAPGLTGVLADFGNPDAVGQVLVHKRRAEEVIKALNLYFTRIVP